MRTKISIIITLLITIIQPIMALEITDLQATGEIWLNEDNQLAVSFRCDIAANVSAKIEGNGRQQLIQSFDEQQYAEYSIYSKSVQLDTLEGNDNPYVLTTFCEKNSTQANGSTFIRVNKLDVAGIEIIIPSSNPSGIVYPTDTIAIRADVVKNNNRLFSGVTFTTAIHGVAAEITNIAQSGKWEISAKIPDVVGDKILTVEATYNGHKASATSSMSIRPLLSVSIESQFLPYKLTDTSDIALPVVVNYKSKPLTDSDVIAFEAQLDGQVLTIKDIKYSSNKWNLNINIPRMPPKENAYNLTIFATYSSVKEEGKQIQIQFLLPFKGALFDANGKAVQAEIRIKKPGFEEKITTINGQYSAMLQPGQYDVELHFPAFRARLKDAMLQSGDNLYAGENVIKYDYFEESRKVIALDFLLPFASARIEMLYNDSDFKDENNIEALKCSNWNFAKRLCDSGWEKVDIIIDKERNLISIETTTLSAFAISEPSELVLNATIDKSSYQAGEGIKLSGSVKEDENPVKAKITYELDGKAFSFDSEGNFETTVKTPESEGEFLLSIKAEKEGRTAEKGISFSVYQKRFIRIAAPSAVEITSGNKTVIITVSNEGQKDINNIVVSIDLPSSWYFFDSNAFNLAAGEYRNIEITLIAPENAESRTVAISAKADEASANSEFMLNIVKKETVKDTVTGQAASDTSNIYLLVFSIILVSILFSFIFLKKKSSKKQKAAIAMLSATKSEIDRKKKKSAKEVLRNPFE